MYSHINLSSLKHLHLLNIHRIPVRGVWVTPSEASQLSISGLTVGNLTTATLLGVQHNLHCIVSEALLNAALLPIQSHTIILYIQFKPSSPVLPLLALHPPSPPPILLLPRPNSSATHLPRRARGALSRSPPPIRHVHARSYPSRRVLGGRGTVEHRGRSECEADVRAVGEFGGVDGGEKVRVG